MNYSADCRLINDVTTIVHVWIDCNYEECRTVEYAIWYTMHVVLQSMQLG